MEKQDETGVQWYHKNSLKSLFQCKFSKSELIFFRCIKWVFIEHLYQKLQTVEKDEGLKAKHSQRIIV